MTRARSVYIERDGVSLHALDHGGEGKPILLLLHGAAAHAHWWDSIVPEFAGRFRSVAVDLRGHGDSGWAKDYTLEAYGEDLEAWLDWARREAGAPPHILAHSMGGAIALELHKRRPPDIRTLIVVDVPLRIGEKILEEIHRFGRNPSRPWASPDIYVQKFRLELSSGNADPDTVAHLVRHSLRPLKDGAWILKMDKSFHLDRRPTDLRPCWKSVRAPAMLIAGEISDRLTRDDLDWIRRECPQVRVDVIPAAHHHVFLDEPEAFLRSVRDFQSAGFS
ncbi:MAG: alpha/beta hydrolase [bacterium]